MRLRLFIMLVFMLIYFLLGPLYAEDHGFPEIHCKHFFYGYPTGTPLTNDLIIRDIYALSSNDETKHADWVAYRLTPHEVYGTLDLEREWRSDPWLKDEETLEEDDYKNASDLGYDRGHQAPLGSFKGSIYASQTNLLSNITPQKRDLNRGAWRVLEEKVRDLVKAGNITYVMTGPLFERDMGVLPYTDESHKVPSGYWKIVIVQTGRGFDSIKALSFIFDQDTPRGAKVIDHLSTVNEIEERSGLDFLRELPDEVEEEIESKVFQEWALQVVGSEQ